MGLKRPMVREVGESTDVFGSLYIQSATVGLDASYARNESSGLRHLPNGRPTILNVIHKLLNLSSGSESAWLSAVAALDFPGGVYGELGFGGNREIGFRVCNIGIRCRI